MRGGWGLKIEVVGVKKMEWACQVVPWHERKNESF
jgi:hypothetical protein